MKTSFMGRALIFILVILLVLPTVAGCGRKITLDDAKYTMAKFFSALDDADYDEILSLLHKSSSMTKTNIQNFLSSVEDKLCASFDDGITNIRYNSYSELPYNGVPGGSKFRVDGSFNIGKVQNVSFIILLVMDSQGYGINVIDFGGVAL